MIKEDKYDRVHVDSLVEAAISELKRSMAENKDLETLLYYRENANRYVQEAIDYHYKFYPETKRIKNTHYNERQIGKDDKNVKG